MKTSPHAITKSRDLAIFCSLVGLMWLTPTIAPHGSISAEDSWPRFLGRDFNGSSEPLGDTIATPVSQWSWQHPTPCRWSLSVGDGYGLGVIDRGAYFHFDVSGGRERLRKVDLQSGEVVWSSSHQITYRDLYGYESGARCSPTLDGEQIFTLGSAGGLTAWQKNTGETQWRVETNEKYHVVQNFFGAGASPLVLGESVLVMIGGSPPADQAIAPGRLDRVSPADSLLVAFDRSTGRELWKCGDDLASYSCPRPIRLNDRDFVIVFGREFLHLIDPQAGKVLGRVRYRADLRESVNAMVPIVQDNRVFVSECYDLGGTLFKVSVENDSATFTPLWQDPAGRRRKQSMRSHLSTPILRDGFLYGCSGRNAPDSDFRCIDFSTGEVKWNALSRRRTTASRLGDVLLILQETGPLHVVKCTPERYEEIAVWALDEESEDADQLRPALRYPCWAAPVIVNTCFLVRGDEKVLCLELPGT